MRIKGHAGWTGSVFLFFFNKNFLYLLRVPLVGLWGLVWGFGVGCGGLISGEVVGVGLSDASTQGMDRMVCSQGGCIWLAPLHGLPSGQSAVFGAWPWIGLSGPGEGLGASLIISLMLCNYIKFQNCR